MPRSDRLVLVRLAAVLTLALLAPSLAAGTRAAVAAPQDCSRPPERVRVPHGFADAHFKFVAMLSDGRQVSGRRFDSGAVRDLSVVVDWREIDRTHIQRLDLYAPDGSLYQRFTTGFTGTGSESSPVPTLLPVSGTSITQASLFGEWCAEVYLDGEDAPIARERFFLTPRR